MLKLEAVAEMVYECNRIYRKSSGEPETPCWNDLDENTRANLRMSIMDVCCHPGVTPKEQHDKWVSHKKRQGWAYGFKEDREKKLTPCMVEYDQLSKSQKIKDMIFIHMSKMVILEDFFKSADAKKNNNPAGDHLGNINLGTFRVGKITHVDGTGFHVLAMTVEDGDKAGYRLIGSEDYDPSSLKDWHYFYLEDVFCMHTKPLEHIEATIRYCLQDYFKGEVDHSQFRFDEYFFEHFKDVIQKVDRRLSELDINE